MADVTIVNGVYKPTNITGGHHHVIPSSKNTCSRNWINKPVGFVIPEAKESSLARQKGRPLFHREIMGKSWENNGKTMGKSRNSEESTL